MPSNGAENKARKGQCWCLPPSLSFLLWEVERQCLLRGGGLVYGKEDEEEGLPGHHALIGHTDLSKACLVTDGQGALWLDQVVLRDGGRIHSRAT